MKKVSFALALSCVCGAALFLTACLKDTVTKTYTYLLYRPVYKTSAAVRANIKSNAPVAVQQPGKLFIQGNFIFLNEIDKGVHIIDNSNPASPKNVAFIDIPGNVDLAVKGNILYADLYTDLVAIDVSTPLAARVTKIVSNVFPERFYNYQFAADTSLIAVDWIVKDTVITEEYAAANWKKIDRGGVVFYSDLAGGFAVNSMAVAPKAAASPVGIGGSMARFTQVADRLYTVGNGDLSVFNTTTASEPSFITKVNIGFNIETIYPFQDKLFIGATNGMFVYSIANADQPVQLSQFTHVQSCDPVITDGSEAYVTLRNGTPCGGFTNELEVLNVSNLLQPILLKRYPLTHPQGLSKDGTLLFVCDDADGLKVFDAAAPDNLQLLQTIAGMETYDIIAHDGLAIVVAKDGLYQFDYHNRNNITQLSKLTIN